MMRTFSFFSPVAMLFLCGCAVGVKNTQNATVYDFGLPAKLLSAAEQLPTLRLDVTAPLWAESTGVDYRLSYEEPLKRREYANSRWAGAPGVLLARHLRQQLGAVGHLDGIAASCRLTIDLQEFSQVFTTPQQSRGVLRVMAYLVDTRREVLAERRLQLEAPAPEPDAGGGVKALLVASSDLGQQLADWLAALQRENRLQVCGAARGTPRGAGGG